MTPETNVTPGLIETLGATPSQHKERVSYVDL